MDAQIPGYTIIRPIGKGGMATVYLAYQHNLERQVALKVLTPSLAANPDFCERFSREAKIGASLCHRNIVPVYDFGHFPLHQYLAMEYLPNGDFKRRMAAGCDTGTVLRIVYDIACALHYAHSKSFIHRDIKPENILFREDQTAVLTDFGIALDMKSAATAGSGDGIIAGSPKYMSPEQARADGLDIRSDIYSLGAVLYEALSRRPLLESGATVADVVRQSEEPVPRLPSDVSWLQPVLERMLARNPGERFADMDEVMRALEPCLKVPESLLGMPPQRVTQFAGGGQPVRERRSSRIEASAYKAGSYKASTYKDSATETSAADASATEAPRLAPSAPTLIDDISQDLELELALANCPPVLSPPMARVPSHRHRSWTGVLLFLLALSALPLAWLYGPALLERGPQLAQQPVTAQLPPDSALPADPIQPTTTDVVPAPAPAAPENQPSTTLAATSAPESAGAALPATAKTAAAESPLPDKSPEVTTPAEPEPAPDPVAQLLQQANNALQHAHPTLLDVTSAYEKYREVLSLDPRNRPAREGLGVVAAKYLELASKALNQDELESAQQYVDRASSIATRHRLGFHITQRIDDLQYALNRIRHLGEQRRAESWS